MTIYNEYTLPNENCPDPLPEGSQIWLPNLSVWSDRCTLDRPVQGQRLTTEKIFQELIGKALELEFQFK